MAVGLLLYPPHGTRNFDLPNYAGDAGRPHVPSSRLRSAARRRQLGRLARIPARRRVRGHQVGARNHSAEPRRPGILGDRAGRPSISKVPLIAPSPAHFRGGAAPLLETPFLRRAGAGDGTRGAADRRAGARPLLGVREGRVTARAAAPGAQPAPSTTDPRAYQRHERGDLDLEALTELELIGVIVPTPLRPRPPLPPPPPPPFFRFLPLIPPPLSPPLSSFPHFHFGVPRMWSTEVLVHGNG